MLVTVVENIRKSAISKKNNEGRFVHGVVKQMGKFSFPMKSVLRIWNIGNIAIIQAYKPDIKFLLTDKLWPHLNAFPVGQKFLD